MAWLLLKLQPCHGRRLVFEVHGLPSAELLDRTAQLPDVRREVRRRRSLEQAVFGGAWRVLTITDCLRARVLSDYAVPADRVVSVPDASRARPNNGPIHSRPNGAGKATSRSARAVSRSGRLIYVGQLYPWKGVDLAVRALSEVPGAELTIVGGLPDVEPAEHLKRLVGELGLTERVHFVGLKPYAEVAGLLEQADVALLPLADGIVARCFTSPLKLFDYLAAGLPIVAVDYPTLREVLRDGVNGLLAPPNDSSAFAAAIRRVLDNPDLAAKLGAQARRDAARYTWEARAEKILSALSADRTPSARVDAPHQ